jgi:uncharacterized protein YbaP (TraB family)
LWRRLAVAFGLIVLLFVHQPASGAGAAEMPRCAGTSLLDKLQRDNPAGYQDLLAAAARVAAGDHLLWRIAGKDGAPDSFLFGTIHYSDDRVTDLPAAVSRALAGAGVVALELAGMPQPDDLQAALRADPTLVALPADKSLYDLLTADAAAALKQRLAAAGADPAMVARFKPWFVSILLGAPPCERVRQAAGLLPVDGVVIKLAGEAGTRLVGLETLPEQLAIMASMPLEAQAAQLTQIVTAVETPEDRYETLLQLYLGHRIGMMFPMIEMEARKDAELGKAVRHMAETLIARRNANMVARALPLVEAGGAFIAVGALHLPGDQGLVELLRARGYKVTPAD